MLRTRKKKRERISRSRNFINCISYGFWARMAHLIKYENWRREIRGARSKKKARRTRTSSDELSNLFSCKTIYVSVCCLSKMLASFLHFIIHASVSGCMCDAGTSPTSTWTWSWNANQRLNHIPAKWNLWPLVHNFIYILAKSYAGVRNVFGALNARI